MLLLALACRVEWGPPQAQTTQGEAELWVYTSIYEEVIAAMEPALAAPGVKLQWYQAGSEKVAQRLEAEWAAGGSPACVVLTSDPSWYADAQKRGKLRAYVPPAALELDRRWVGSHASAVRLSTMVIAVSEDLPPEERPTRMDDLARFAADLSLPDPLSSGTAFTTVALLGVDWAQGLKAAGAVLSGGNSSVIQRIESGERKVGVVLLENVLKARKKGSRILPILPEDGAVLIPGMVAITADCHEPLAAMAFVDKLLEDAVQSAIVAGYMHSPRPGFAAPEGAPVLEQLGAREWPAGFAATLAEQAPALREALAGAR